MARQLNKQIREDLALQLACKAIAKNGAALARLANHIRSTLEARHIAMLKEVAPDVSPARWAELIQARLVAGYGGNETLYVTKMEGERKTTGHITTDYIEQRSRWNKSGQPKWARWQRFISEALGLSGFSVAAKLIHRSNLSRDHGGYLSMTSPSNPAIPFVPNCGTLDVLSDDPADAKLAKDVRAFLARFHRILKDGWTFHEECLDLLNACKSEKQLLDLFPEAAKLLPPDPEKVANIVPVEQAQKLRKMLETGVPED